MIPCVVLLFVILSCEAEAKCPPWRLLDNVTESCRCGSSLHLINCDSDSGKLSVPHCYCMTWNKELDEITFGQCIYTCVSHHRSFCHTYDKIQSNSSATLNYEVCGSLKRTGHLCGDCIPNYGYPVFSNSLKCVECNEKDSVKNIIKYLLLMFGSLTLFYIVIIIFKVSITSHYLVAYVYICQSLTLPFCVKFYQFEKYYLKILAAYFSMWNLDFMRLLVEPFCLHPELSAIQVMSLDYLTAVYPMCLVLVTSVAVFLHDRYAIIVFLWRPIAKVMKCIRKNWNIRGSLIQTFATLFVLSYVKILNVSFELLTSVTVFNDRGRTINQRYVFSAGTEKFFGATHFPFGILAAFMLLVFNILPVLLLVLYPMNCFKKWMCSSNLTLFTFLDTFYGSYRTHPSLYRSFAAVYFVARIVELLLLSILRDYSIFLYLSVCQIILSIIVTLVQPYSKKYQNKVDRRTFIDCRS